MSQENLKVVEAAYAALTSDGLDAFAESWAEDVEMRTVRGASLSGKAAWRAYLQELLDLFDDFRIEPIEFIDAAGEGVVVCLRYGGRSKLSGMAVPPEYFALVVQVRDGDIAQGVEYRTREEALEAAGVGK